MEFTYSQSMKLKRILFILWILVTFHTVKDVFQDYLETDFLYFIDANENVMALPKWGRWTLVIANQTADILVWLLVFLTPIALGKKKLMLEKMLMIGYILFFVVVATDLLLDPRIKNPTLFFDKSTRTSTSQMKEKYREILHQGPF